MKKLLLLMSAAAVGLALVACGNTNGNNEPPEDPNAPKITFSAGEGAFTDGKDSVVVRAGSNGKVTIKDAPVRDGYAFIGWYDSSSAQFNPNTAYEDGSTFTARYVSGKTDSVYAALFDEDSEVSIDIDMSDAEWKKLNNDYVVFKNKGGKSPIYRMANSVTIGIDDGDGMLYYYYEEVGVRMKGNTSRHEFYGNDGFFDNVHMKLSFKETFDDEDDGYEANELKVWSDTDARTVRKNRTFGGMEKIDVKYNSTNDETYVREMYAMKMFRDNGVVAPHVTMCSLTALEKNRTKKNMGLYRVHEPIDEVFVLRYFGDDKAGDLWKCTYTVTGPADMTDYDLDNRIGVEDELKGKFYSYDKKTNKKKDKTTGLRDLTSMRNFIEAISDPDVNFSDYVDIESFTRFEAVNYVLGNPDCIRNNYNNYYVYFRKSDGKAVIIPYDYDRCLGLTSGWNPTGSASMYLEPFTEQIAANGNGQYNPLYKNLITKGAPYEEGSALMAYRDNLLALAESNCVTTTAFNAYKNKYKSRYGKYTNGAISSNSLKFDADNTGNVSYSDYMSTKLDTLMDNIDNYRI